MRKSTQYLNRIATDPWFLVATGTASIAAFIWFLYEQPTSTPSAIFSPVLYFTLALLTVGYVYSVKIRAENIALRGISEEFFEINQIYREKLRELFNSDDPVTNAVELLDEEELALKAICQRIGNIYSRITNRKCMVTVKLVTIENEQCYAHTYVRNQELCPRDSLERIRYSVGTGDNTGFDVALAKRPNGLPPHFYSPDLQRMERQNEYFNQRPHYYRHYRSTLVVPIRGSRIGKESSEREFDLIGFLCVDTLSINRLNNGYHLYMLSALASQMYNFMSLMRGRYTVVVG